MGFGDRSTPELNGAEVPCDTALESRNEKADSPLQIVDPPPLPESVPEQGHLDPPPRFQKTYNRRPAPPTVEQRQPRLFLAFSHNTRAERVARVLRDRLSRLGIEVYRAMDDPRPGESIQARILQAIDWADAIVILWSELASRSEMVRWEYHQAVARGKKPCLVKFPGVDPPEEWPPDIEYLPLSGVSFPQGLGGLLLPAAFAEPAWTRFVEVIRDFAFRERSAVQGRGSGYL